MWSDPDPDVATWEENERGVSVIFSNKVIESFLNKVDMDLVCRAHQVKK